MKIELASLKDKFTIFKKKDNSKIKLQMQFINFLTYFNAYVSSGSNVYQAFKSTSNILNGEIKNYLDEMIILLDEDKTISPYMDFARHFDNETITQIITMVYQLNNNGLGLEQIEHMIPLLEKLKNITISEAIKKESSDLNIFLMTPLLGVTIVSVFFSLGVLSTIMQGVS